MSNETKRDVFEKALREWDDLVHSCGLQGEEAHGGCEFDPILIKYKKDYDTALPDDLPVVPKDVSNTMRTYYFLWWKEFLDKAYNNELNDDEDINYKVRSESAEVARALILGMWRVKETGEIVKLEGDKI